MDRSGVLRFGPFAFDRARMVLEREGQLVPLGGRGAALLSALTDAQGQVVTRNELLEAGWPGLVVEERNLTGERDKKELNERRNELLAWASQLDAEYGSFPVPPP